jgi:hypothetical protein
MNLQLSHFVDNAGRWHIVIAKTSGLRLAVLEQTFETEELCLKAISELK